MITLAADVGAVSENHLAAFRRPAALTAAELTKQSGGEETRLGSARGSALGQYSQDGVIPEDADGFRALLGGDKAELHGDGFVQMVLQPSVVVVERDADHRRVDDRTLWHPDDDQSAQTFKIYSNSPKSFLLPLFPYRRLLLSES